MVHLAKSGTTGSQGKRALSLLLVLSVAIWDANEAKSDQA